MNMSIDRAIEILEPANIGPHSPTEWVSAHRMACQALALLRWKDAARQKPDPDEFVLVVCSASLGRGFGYDNELAIAEYDETKDAWILEDWPEAADVRVSHWMRLPELPDELREANP